MEEDECDPGWTDRQDFRTIPDVYLVYGEPCNNCTLYYEGALCEKKHRQKLVSVATGHIPELTVRRQGGCPDHELKEGVWWNEEPLQRTTGDYGGNPTSILA